MADKFFEQLMTLFDEQYKENIDTINQYPPEIAGIVRDYWLSIKMLVDAQKKTEAVQAQNKPLSQEDYNFLVTGYKNFIKCSQNLLEIQQGEGAMLYGASIVADFNTKVENYLYPAKQYLEDIEAKGPQVNLKEVYANKKWISDMFASDPNKEALKGSPTKEVVPEISFSGNIIKYVETVEKLKKKYNGHLQLVTQSKFDAMESLKVKQEMIKEVIQEAYGNEEIPFNLRGLYDVHKVIGQMYNTDSLTTINTESLLNKEFFEYASNYLLQKTIVRGHIENSYLSEQNQKYILEAYSKMSIDPANLGISPDDLQVLDMSSEQLLTIDSIRRNIFTSTQGQNLADRKHPLFYTWRKLGEIDKKLTAVFSGESTDVPTEEIRNLMDALANYATTQPRFNAKGTEDPMVTICFDCCIMLNKSFSGTVGDLFITAENNFNARVKEQFNEIYQKLGTAEPQEAPVLFNNANSLLGDHVIDDNEYEKFYALRLARDRKFRNSEIIAATNAIKAYGTNGFKDKLDNYYGADHSRNTRNDEEKMMKSCVKTLMLGYMYEKEFKACKEYVELERSNVNPISINYKKGYNNKLAPAVTKDEMHAKELGDFESQTFALKNYEKVQEIMNKSCDDMKAFFAGDINATLENTLYGDSAEFDKKFKAETMDALATVKKGPKKSNSESYTEMTEQVEDFMKSGHKVGGHSIQDYADLYNSLRKYVNTHDSDPFTTHGKERFNAAETLLCDVGLKIMKMRPNSNAAMRIEKDFKINMIRSKVFREACTTKGTEYNMPSITKDAQDIGRILSNAGKEMITGKMDLDKPEVENKLLEQYAGALPVRQL